MVHVITWFFFSKQLDIHDAMRLDKQYMFTQMQQNHLFSHYRQSSHKVGYIADYHTRDKDAVQTQPCTKMLGQLTAGWVLDNTGC